MTWQNLQRIWSTQVYAALFYTMRTRVAILNINFTGLKDNIVINRNKESKKPIDVIRFISYNKGIQ